MKKFSVLFLSFACIIFIACENQSCENLDCKNLGTCYDGTCICTSGFEGEFCTINVADKFVGTYVLDELPDCDYEFPIAQELTIEKGGYSAQILRQKLIVASDDRPAETSSVYETDKFSLSIFEQVGGEYTDVRNDVHQLVDAKYLEVTRNEVRNYANQDTSIRNTCYFRYTKQ